MSHGEAYTVKVKKYLQVFYYLLALTGAELIVVYIPGIPHTLTTLLVCVLSLSKALCVGWWYMHLNHESRGLKGLAILPLIIAFFYATYLVWDAPKRPVSPYLPESARTFHGESAHKAEAHAAESSAESVNTSPSPATPTDGSPTPVEPQTATH